VTKTPDGFYELNPRPHGSQMKVLDLVGDARRVLDVGCSTGYLAERLQQRGATVVGLDMDERAAELARRFCEEVLVGDVETMDLPFEPGSFDAIVCGDLIEHLRDPQGFLERIRPLLRPGGRLVLSTPNIANWAMRLSLLFGRFRYTEWGILDRTHTHFFTRKTLRECLEAAGYRIDVFDHTVPVPVLSSPWAEELAHRLGRLRPSLLAYQFVVAAVPADEQQPGDDRSQHPEESESPVGVGAPGRDR
jgi:2-polyprenyl-3-methyl-5-hydroxy-6-metoxy-1,4-benzoquinol methylase